jgi:hypothetical protein
MTSSLFKEALKNFAENGDRRPVEAESPDHTDSDDNELVGVVSNIVLSTKCFACSSAFRCPSHRPARPPAPLPAVETAERQLVR